MVVRILLIMVAGDLWKNALGMVISVIPNFQKMLAGSINLGFPSEGAMGFISLFIAQLEMRRRILGSSH